MKRLAIAVLILLLTAGVSFATTAQQVDFLLSGSLDGDGSVNSGGKVYTCDAGTVCGSSTSNPKTTWQDANKVTPHANPIILDAFGRATVFADGNYKFQIDDSSDVLVETIDNIIYEVTTTTVQSQDTLTTASETIVTTVDTYYCDASSGNVTTDFSGVSAVGNTGKRFTFKKIDSTTNTCTIDPLSSQTIDGATTTVIRNQYDDITIESDGSNWTEVRGMVWSRAATFHNTVTFYNGISVDTLSESTSGSGVTVDGLLIKDSGANAVIEQGGGSNLLVQTYDIGVWDMNADITNTVAHGLSDKVKIRMGFAVIRPDSATSYFNLNGEDNAGGGDGSVDAWDSTNVTLLRVTGGTFDAVGFDTTSADLDNAAAVDKSGGLVGIPITAHLMDVTLKTTLAGTTNYDGTYTIVSQTANEIVITATFVAETFAGGGAETATWGRGWLTLWYTE